MGESAQDDPHLCGKSALFRGDVCGQYNHHIGPEWSMYLGATSEKRICLWYEMQEEKENSLVIYSIVWVAAMRCVMLNEMSVYSF